MLPLRCRVKAAAVANLSDARYFAARGVDYLGFALEPGATGAVAEPDAAAMRGWIEGPAVVGECGHLPVGECVRLAAALALDRVQVGAFAEVAAVGGATGLPVLQALVLARDSDLDGLDALLARNARHVEAFVVDASRGGLTWPELVGVPARWRWLARACAHFPVLLDLPAGPGDVDGVLAELRPLGLQLTGGDELAAGLKSFDELEDWFEVLSPEP